MVKFKSLGEKEQEIKCIGCSIANKEVIPLGGIIYEGKHFLVHHDPEIPITGFLIISSKKHIQGILELNQEEQKELTEIIIKARKMINILEDVDDVYFIQKEASNHFHMWIVPRRKFDKEKFGFKLKGLTEYFDYAKEHFDNEEKKEEIIAFVNKAKAIQ